MESVKNRNSQNSEELEDKIEVTIIASGIPDTSEKREPAFHPLNQ